MPSSTQRRQVAVGAFGVLGAALAFLIGARIGNTLDHNLRTMSVARVPIPVAAIHEPAPVIAVAQR
jgi:hypothetical protein